MSKLIGNVKGIITRYIGWIGPIVKDVAPFEVFGCSNLLIQYRVYVAQKFYIELQC